MKLTKYRVTDFRSVKDSDWIEVDQVTALIGVNESGKTNLLLPLWKFRPAREGLLEPTSDYPKKMFGDIRQKPEEYRFIEVEFDTSSEAEKFAKICGYPADQLTRLSMSKRYDNKFEWSFPNAEVKRSESPAQAIDLLKKAKSELQSLDALKGRRTTRADLSIRSMSRSSAWKGLPL